MKNDWEKKATCSAYLSTIIKHFLEFAPSNGNGPTDPLHISCICSIWKILHFYSSLSLNPSKSAFWVMLQKIRFFKQKRPKTIAIRIIVRMTIFKSIHMALYANTSWACALLRNNKQHVVLGAKEKLSTRFAVARCKITYID
jgi:hypothetical protein